MEKRNRNKYWAEYKKEHYSRIVLEVEPNLKTELKQKAKEQNKTLTQYIKEKVAK